MHRRRDPCERRVLERSASRPECRSGTGGGTGLGLAIAKHAVQRHSGEFEVRSVVGKDSTFRLLFPAPSPRRARILLAEKGVAHETVQVDLRNGEQLSDASRRINPHCTVPTLRTQDGLLLTDNAAITAYLEARYPQPPLLGSTPACSSSSSRSISAWRVATSSRRIASASPTSRRNVAVDFARVVKVKPGELHPHLQRWRAAMAQRPALAL